MVKIVACEYRYGQFLNIDHCRNLDKTQAACAIYLTCLMHAVCSLQLSKRELRKNRFGILMGQKVQDSVTMPLDKLEAPGAAIWPILLEWMYSTGSLHPYKAVSSTITLSAGSNDLRNAQWRQKDIAYMAKSFLVESLVKSHNRKCLRD